MKILNWTPRPNGISQRGFIDVEFNMGLQIRNCVVDRWANGTVNVSPPARAKIINNELVRKRSGKPDYEAIIVWANDQHRHEFVDYAIELLLQKDPNALG